jgi:hypothetical protein
MKFNVTVYDYFKANNRENLSNCLVKFVRSNGLMILRAIRNDLTPLTEFPNKEMGSNFKEYFMNKYELETKYENQPLIQVDYVTNSSNFIMRRSFQEKKKKDPKYELLFLSEHFKLICFDLKTSYFLFMLPSIFYRADCLLKSRKLMLQIENYLVANLNITKVF